MANHQLNNKEEPARRFKIKNKYGSLQKKSQIIEKIHIHARTSSDSEVKQM